MLIFVFLVAFLPVSAQNKSQVSGTIVSDADGTGLPGVTIMIKGTQSGTSTDLDGRFTLDIDTKNDTLVVSMIGFQTQEVMNFKTTDLNIQLREEAQELETVVIVGYGEQKKASSVGSITQTKGSDIIKTGGLANVSSSLQGMLPGVTAISNSGEPGDDQASIFIRGRATWGTSAPLILVDGIERSMNGIDPNEIETISVLKDASATAVFGVKGANGVILITTKRGSIGAPKMTFNSTFGIKKPTFSFEHLDQATSRELYNEARMNESDWGGIYTEENIDYWRTGIDPYYHPEIDWKDEVLRPYGITQQYNVNVSGGNEKVKYFASVGYLRDGDIYKTKEQADYDPRFRYERYNFRNNVDYKLSKLTELSVNLAGEVGERNRPLGLFGSDPLDGANVDAFNETFYTAPNYLFPVRYENGVLGATPIDRRDNLVYNLNYQGGANEKSTRLFSDVILKQDLDPLLKGLSVKGKLSYNTYFETQQVTEKDILGIYQPAPDVDPQWHSDATPVEEWVEKPAVLSNRIMSEYDRYLYYELSTFYSNQFGPHNVSALALFNRRESREKTRFPHYEESWVSRVTYSYDNRYLAEVNGAYTGSEKFARGKRFGFFPSYGIGWVISEENFVKNAGFLKFMTFLKAKYTYGKVGVDRGASAFTYITDYETGGSAAFGNTQAYAYGPLYFEGQAANVNATWETATKENLAFELELFSKLSLNLDLYNERRTGILMSRENTTPAWFGQEATDANIGETKSHGYEVVLEWRDDLTKDISYFIQVATTFQENRIIYRDDPASREEYLKYEGKQISYSSRLLAEGFNNSWDDVYNNPASVWENDARQPGDIVYVDFNGDGVIDDFDKVPMKLNTIPSNTVSATLGFSIKNFDVRGNFYGVWGVEKRLPSELLWEFPNRYVMAWPESVQRWTPETAETATRPRLGVDIVKHNRENSTYGLYDASYLRLKTLEVAYNLDRKLLSKIGLSACTIFVNGNNLITFTDFDKRIDPETANSGAYPLTKRYNTGFRMTF